jgi:transcriptional regulator with XRE-family HTH domain
MSSKKVDAISNLTDKELAGFVELTLAGELLPEPSDEVLAYLERLSHQYSLSEAVAFDEARSALSTIIKLKLHAAHPQPVRPLGMHILAKRTEALCKLEDVARVLGEPAERLQAIERRTVNPLSLGTETLAKVAEVFGLYVSELREALRAEATSPPGRPLGLSFARSGDDDFKPESIRIAADDLRRGAKSSERFPPPAALELVESTVRAVSVTLERKGLSRLVDAR